MYIKLRPRDKRPVEQWTNSKYQYGYKELIPWVQAGGNIGYVCGINDIIVLDIDSPARVEDLNIKPFVTRAIKTGNKGFHLYYKCPGAKKVVLIDKKAPTWVSYKPWVLMS